MMHFTALIFTAFLLQFESQACTSNVPPWIGYGHCVFDCPHFQGFWQQHAEIFQDSHDAMRSLMWHNDQKSVCALVLAIVNEAQTA